MSVRVFTSDFYSGIQSVPFLSVFVRDSTDNLLVSLHFFSVATFSVEGYIESGVFDTRHLLYETISVIYLKQKEICNTSQIFGLKTKKCAAVGQCNTRYHSTNEEEIVISYTDFSKNHPVITGRLSYDFLYVKFRFVVLKIWLYTFSSIR